MDVIDERVLLEEVCSRLNDFFAKFPAEARRILGEPVSFGNEVAEMFEALVGSNIEVPFGLLLVSMLSGPTTDPKYHLAVDFDDDNNMVGFKVIEIPAMTKAQAVEGARKKLGIERRRN